MKVLVALKHLQKETKAEVFLVGGFVRDYLRNKKNDDFDVVVRKLSSKAVVAFLKDYGKCKNIALAANNDAFVTELILFRPFKDHNVTQIVLPRRGKRQIADKNNTLSQDAKYRDFKINAMYLPIDFKSKADVIDVVGGLADIRNRTISCVSDVADCLSMSPIRVLRAASLAAHTGYKIDDNLFLGLKSYGHALENVIPEAIRKELNKVLLSKKPSRYIKLMRKLGILKFVIPELDNCFGVTQDKRYHKYDVFTHCVYTCDNTKPDLTLRLAGLLHDVGKPGTKKKVDGRVSFHKHEMLSVKLARTFLNHLRYDSRTKTDVLSLVRMHMYHYTRDYGDVAVRRFIKKAGITKKMLDSLGELPLFQLRIAERLGNGLKTDPVTQKQLDFEDRIRKVFESGGGLKLEDLNIDGHIIMEAFSIKSGKQVGEIINYLLERVQRDKKLNDRITLIELTLQYLQSQKQYRDTKSR